MSIDSNYPFGINDVPDDILGSKPVSRKYTNQIARLPGGYQAGITNENTGPLQVPTEVYSRILPVRQLPHLVPGFEATFVHRQFLGFIGASANIIVINFRVPDGFTLFVEKYIFKTYDSNYESIKFIPTQDRQNIRALTTTSQSTIDVTIPTVSDVPSQDHCHLPTLPMGQRNTRVEIEQSHTAGIRIINEDSARRRVAVAFIGWLDRLRHEDRVVRR